MVDRISMLSDEVLCHILSFLRTEEAAATSVLSKRWRHLWTSVPVLDYDDRIYLRNDKPAACFERFVYATILARDPHQPITSFRLKYQSSPTSGPSLSDVRVSRARSSTDVNFWVKSAIRRGIENLDINIELLSVPNCIISLSSCIFSCRTLVVLKLIGGLSLDASSSVDLPSLKSLHLEKVTFIGPQYLMELLYGCPMLEDLKLVRIGYADDEDYYVKEEVKSLPKLVRADLRVLLMDKTNVLLKTVCNVEFLKIKQCQVGDEVAEFPHLRHLSLGLDNRSWHSVLLMLKNCPKLQSFKLFQSVQVLPYRHFVVVPECLTSHLKKCYLKSYQGKESELLFAKYIMQNSTYLQSMKIRAIFPPNPFEALKDLALCSRKSALCELSFDLYELPKYASSPDVRV